MEFDDLSRRVIGCAIEVHREPGQDFLNRPLTCMKLAGIKTGLLVNFNVTKLKDGIQRFVL